MKAQLPKYDVRTIVVIKRNLMPLRDIGGRQVCELEFHLDYQ